MSDTPPNHALVVGGTGMLRAVSLALAERGNTVSVIARNPNKLAVLQRAVATMMTGRVNPIALDYNDEEAFHTALNEATAQHGPISLSVVWVHGNKPAVLRGLTNHVQGRYVHVLGSTSERPGKSNPSRRKYFDSLDHIDYQEVILGFILDEGSGHSRWLTNEEISFGVLRALDSTQSQFVVGQVEPWDAHP